MSYQNINLYMTNDFIFCALCNSLGKFINQIRQFISFYKNCGLLQNYGLIIYILQEHNYYFFKSEIII